MCTLRITDFGWASYSMWGGYRKAEKTISTNLRDEDLYSWRGIKPEKLNHIYFILAEIIAEITESENIDDIYIKIKIRGDTTL